MGEKGSGEKKMEVAKNGKCFELRTFPRVTPNLQFAGISKNLLRLTFRASTLEVVPPDLAAAAPIVARVRVARVVVALAVPTGVTVVANAPESLQGPRLNIPDCSRTNTHTEVGVVRGLTARSTPESRTSSSGGLITATKLLVLLLFSYPSSPPQLFFT